LIETLFAWWTDVLRASNGVARVIWQCKKGNRRLAARFTTAEILKRIRALEELRDHLGRISKKPSAIEVTFLTIFTGNTVIGGGIAAAVGCYAVASAR